MPLFCGVGEIEERQQITSWSPSLALMPSGPVTESIWSAGRARTRPATRPAEAPKAALSHSPPPRSARHSRRRLSPPGRWRQQRPHLWLLGLRHLDLIACVNCRGDEQLGEEVAGPRRSGTVTSASRLDPITLSRRSGSIASVTWLRSSRSCAHCASSASTAGTSGHSSKCTDPASGIARAPHFLAGEHQHRREPAHQRVEQGVEHGPVGAALRSIAGGASQ